MAGCHHATRDYTSVISTVAWELEAPLCASGDVGFASGYILSDAIRTSCTALFSECHQIFSAFRKQVLNALAAHASTCKLKVSRTPKCVFNYG